MVSCALLITCLAVGQVTTQVAGPPAWAQSPSPSFGVPTNAAPYSSAPAWSPAAAAGPSTNNAATSQATTQVPGQPAGVQTTPAASAATPYVMLAQAAGPNLGQQPLPSLAQPAGPQAQPPVTSGPNAFWTTPEAVNGNPTTPCQTRNNGNASNNDDKCNTGSVDDRGFCGRLFKAYYDDFTKQDDQADQTTPPARRALPAPFESPPFPMSEWQGFPLIGLPPSTSEFPLMKAIYGGPNGDCIKESRIKAYGWVNASVNFSNCKNSNTVDSYWVVPNHIELDQFVFRVEREVDSVQQDHVDWGFRSTVDYGIDYRYFTAGGWFSNQLLVRNALYGWDPTEQYFNLYVPGVAEGTIITIGRWIATPDIETQYAPDNYMGTHSLLFTIDVYTETGIMATTMLNKQWTVQAAIHAGADMAPWYAGAVPTGMFGVRWVSRDNNDSVYTVLNAINNAEFQYFNLNGQPAGHHNYNIFQSTWQHKFNENVHTKTEAYVMWERNAAVGGTPSIGPFQFNSGGGLGPTVPGLSMTYAVLNYTMFKTSKKDFITVRNEWTNDQNGTRYGFAGNYTSNAIGWSHNLSSTLQIRPEIGYYRSWDNAAFDNGARKDMILVGFDTTWRF